MMCYKDMTFCISPACKNACGRKLTKEIVDAADRWWNGEKEIGKRTEAPIAMSCFCCDTPLVDAYKQFLEKKE